MENDETMFDEIVRTEIKPDGTVEASLVENSAQEMEAPSPIWSRRGKISRTQMAISIQSQCGRTTGGKRLCTSLSPRII